MSTLGPRVATRHTALPTRPPPTRAPLRRRPATPHPPSATPADAAPADTSEEDLLQYDGRERWYVAPFAADDQTDWWAASVTSVDDVVPSSVRLLTIDAEASRERVPLRNAYVTIGQRARVRVAGGAEATLPVASPPWGAAANARALVAARGDVYAGEIKTVRDPVSLRVPLQVWVTPKSAPDLWRVAVGDPVDVGPFVGGGAALKPIAGAFAYPTLVIFVFGAGAAPARALLTCPAAEDALAMHLRSSIVVYVRAPTAADVAWRSDHEAWARAAATGPGDTAGPTVRVLTSTRDTFVDMFDGDDELEYNPASTAAIIFAGGDEEALTDALAACKAADIEAVVRGDEDGPAIIHTDTAKVP